jgi:RNA polymerase sigma factor (sigma-70 family)
MREPFERVVARHGPTVLRVCLSVLRHADAEDAWSETFLAALRAYPELPDDVNLEAWLVTVARRKAIDVVRRSARTTPVDVVPDRAVTDPVRDLDLWDALGALPPKQRQAVVYHHVAGLPYDDVAVLLGGTAAAARRAAADGIAHLRRSPVLEEES